LGDRLARRGVGGPRRLQRTITYVQARAQYFSVEVGDYDGEIQDYEAGLLWSFSRHFGAGVAYNVFRTDVEAEDVGNFVGKLRWECDGAQVFVRAAF
jgi:hypothetical protein